MSNVVSLHDKLLRKALISEIVSSISSGKLDNEQLKQKLEELLREMNNPNRSTTNA